MDLYDNDAPQPAAQADGPDPQQVLDSVVSELEVLLPDVWPLYPADLIELHAALLVYNLGGRAEVLPAPSFGLSPRRRLARRIARRAQGLAARGRGDAVATMAIAADVIEVHVHLIDPELRSRVA